jgi:predicted amidohydrolase
MCSYSETTKFYSPGTAPVIFDVDGFRFGCLICVEINFPELFMEYGKLGVDKVFHTKALAHAAIHNFWIGLSIPSQRADMFMSGLIDPNGDIASSVTTNEGLLITDMDKDHGDLDIALNKARPWRTIAGNGEFYTDYRIDDVRSSNRTCA